MARNSLKFFSFYGKFDMFNSWFTAGWQNILQVGKLPKGSISTGGLWQSGFPVIGKKFAKEGKFKNSPCTYIFKS